MSADDSAATRRRGGLGGLIASTKTTPAAPPVAETSVPADTVPPPPPPVPKLPAPVTTPIKVGNVAVTTDRRGRSYVQKTCNVPLDLALWIQEQLGTFRRREDGAITHQFQDVMIDLMHAGRAAIEEKKTTTE